MKIFNFSRSEKKETKQSFQLSNLIEILQDGVAISNVSGELVFLNRSAFSLLAIEKNQDLSKINFFEDCIQDQARSEILKQQINQRGLVRNYELQLRKTGGGVLDVILTINIIGDFRQQNIGFLFLFKDVTELKKIQQQLLQSQKLESIGLMASGIAHDFNNILAAIIPNAELIKMSQEKSNGNYKRAEIIEKSAHRASDIAQRLLTFTRHNDGIKHSPISLNRVINDSLDLLEHSIPKNVKITKQFDSNLYFIVADDTQIQQIVMNLVINATDAMPGGGTIILKTENFQIDNYYQVGSLDPGDFVRFSVIDSGSGIPLEIIPKIFDPFFTTKEIGKGTGLGLSVVYGIVKGLNGHIEVDSRLNEGTRFDIFFPVDKSVAEKAKFEEIQEIVSRDLTLLIVDDEDYVLNILGDILEFLGYTVIKQHSGQEAVTYYASHKDEIDYVIVDLKMPKMDGRATCAELRKIDPSTKIIFTSGFDDQPFDEESLAGVVGFLKKPYSINVVAKLLEEIFSREEVMKG